MSEGPSGKQPIRPQAHGTVVRRGELTSRRATRMLPHVGRDGQHGEVEVVSSGEQIEGTRVRSRVQAAGSASRGFNFNLRQKIMIAMAGVVLLTTLLIFIVVYVKAVDQLSTEIDAKGAAQAQLMSSIDPEIWLTAMYQDKVRRQNNLIELIRRVDDRWSPESGFAKDHPDLKDRYETLLTGSMGEARREEFRRFFRNLVEERKKMLPADEQQKLDRRYGDEIKKKEFQALEYSLFDPLGELKLLRSSDVQLLKPEELVELAVLDITKNEEPPDASVTMTGIKSIGGRQNERTKIGRLRIYDDGYVEKDGSKIPVRSFKLDSGEIKTRMGTFKLRYYVLLGLRQIEEAEQTLRTIIFLAIFLAVLVGLAIAWWVSERISEPVRLLMDDINAVSEGDLEHETIPHSRDEIGQLAGTFNRMTKALKAAHDHELEAKAMEHELNIASEIQANLVPKKMVKISNLDIGAYYRPCKEVGGDYYDFIEIDDDHCGFIVADVSGKGVPGSLVMSMARAFIRMEADRAHNISPSDTLKRTNKMLAADIKKGMFVTAIYCILTKSTNELAVSSAGHNPMIVWRAATKEYQLVNPKGIALGFDKGPIFERTIAEEVVRLDPGDRVTMYTDGTVEAMNERNEEFGSKTFYALVQKLATRDSGQFLSLIVKALDEHKGNAPQHDDMTMVTFRRGEA